MRTKFTGFFLVLVSVLPANAHRLDEYLQATIVSVGHNQITATMRLIPGVAVANAVISAVDLNGDGAFSEAEERRYAGEVLGDLSLSLDGRPLKLKFQNVRFPAPADMREGMGEMHIGFAADLPAGSSHRRLVIENHHQPRISVYLMNCLLPQDQSVIVTAQMRNQNQSYYRIDYAQSVTEQDSLLMLWQQHLVSALASFNSLPAMFRLGVRHIASGTDHLLFLLALLLPAALLPGRSGWGTFGSLRRSLIQIARVVTAFTIGHSVTLALGASGLVSLPERPVEILIAFSILVSAAHALHPLFPGRESIIAMLFGLIHGMAFATTLQNLGLGPWQRLANILGFNLGIEAMQLVVVAAILPSLLILSRTPAFTVFRWIGALFAGLASLGWMVERLFGIDFAVDPVVTYVAQRGPWIAGSLFAISLAAWLRQNVQTQQRIVTDHFRTQTPLR